MDFSTLQNIIQTGLKEDIFKIRAESIGSSQISEIMNLFYNGELLLEQASLTNMENRIIVTGRHTVDIFGESALQGTYDFFLVNDNPQCTIGIIFPNNWLPETLKSTLDGIFSIFQCTYNIADSGLIISSVSNVIPPQNVSHLPSVPQTISQGILIFSSFNGSGPPFNLLESVFGGLMPLNLRNLMNIRDSTLGPIEATLQLALPSLGPISFSNTRFVFQREVFSLINDISLDIGNEVLLLTGGGEVHPDNTFEILFSLVGVRKEGQQEIEANEWVNPLGLTGLTIRKFGVSIGVETRGTIYGIYGEIAFGKEENENQIILGVGGEIINGTTPQALIASIKSSNPSNNDIALTEVIEGLSMLPVGEFPILNKIKVEHFEVYIVLKPEGYLHPINNVTYNGLSLNTSISLFGFSIEADMQFIPNAGIKAKGELGRINLGGVLEITDASGERGPLFQIDTTRESVQDSGYVYLSCKLSLFGLYNTFEAKANQDGFSLKLNYSIQGLGNFQLDCLLKKDEFHGSSEINFDFGDRTISLSIGGQQIGNVHLGSQTVGSLRLGGHVSGRIEVHLTAQTFQLNLSGNLSALGLPGVQVQLTINESLDDLSNLVELLYQNLLREAEELLRTPLNNPALLLQWAQSGVVNLTREVGDILKNFYHVPIMGASKLLKQVGFSSSQAAKILTAGHYQGAERMIGSFLKGGGYGASEVLRGLHEGLEWDVKKSINELAAGFMKEYDIVAQAIVDVLNFNEIDTAKALKDAYGNVKVVAGAIKKVWNKTINEVCAILKNSEFILSDVALGIMYLGELEFGDNHTKISEIVSKALISSNYSLENVADGIKAIYTITQEGLTALLINSKFPSDDVVKFAKEKLNWGVDKITEVLVQLNVKPQEIIGGLKAAKFPDIEIKGVDEKIGKVLNGDVVHIDWKKAKLPEPKLKLN